MVGAIAARVWTSLLTALHAQRGQTAAEYLGVVVVVAAVVAVLATTDIGTEIKQFLQSVIGDISDGGR